LRSQLSEHRFDGRKPSQTIAWRRKERVRNCTLWSLKRIEHLPERFTGNFRPSLEDRILATTLASGSEDGKKLSSSFPLTHGLISNSSKLLSHRNYRKEPSWIVLQRIGPPPAAPAFAHEPTRTLVDHCKAAVTRLL
jgi:hypothetical protein